LSLSRTDGTQQNGIIRRFKRHNYVGKYGWSQTCLVIYMKNLGSKMCVKFVIRDPVALLS
jgi:hypothetical protein